MWAYVCSSSFLPADSVGLLARGCFAWYASCDAKMMDLTRLVFGSGWAWTQI
jgi:hypothetical protein